MTGGVSSPFPFIWGEIGSVPGVNGGFLNPLPFFLGQIGGPAAGPLSGFRDPLPFFLGLIGEGPASIAILTRRTLSPFGTRTGSRQAR